MHCELIKVIEFNSWSESPCSVHFEDGKTNLENFRNLSKVIFVVDIRAKARTQALCLLINLLSLCDTKKSNSHFGKLGPRTCSLYKDILSALFENGLSVISWVKYGSCYLLLTALWKLSGDFPPIIMWFKAGIQEYVIACWYSEWLIWKKKKAMEVTKDFFPFTL